MDGGPSRTAWSAALHRAAHQVVDGGRVFADPQAVAITGWSADQVAADALAHPDRRGMRAFLACRHRLAAEVVAAAPPDAQVVVLGAGLDTTAYRPLPTPGTRLPVFEVDHPATQAWKLELVARAGLQPVLPLTHVPADLETDSLAELLHRAGLRDDRPVVVLWLGVVVYLSRPAVDATLAELAGLTRAGLDLVADYGEPRTGTSAADRRHARRAAAAAAVGEPWRTRLTPQQWTDLLAGHGFEVRLDLGPSGWAERWLGLPGLAPQPGGHLALAHHATG